MNNTEHLYECAEFFLGRTSLFPFDATQKISFENCLDFVKEQTEFLEAVSIASPNLYNSFCKIMHSKNDEQKLKKIYQGLLKYFLRMTYRATPFGAFSFVWQGEFTSETLLKFETSSVEKSAYPDMEWIHNFIEILHQHADFVKNLKVMVNPLIIQEGERYFLKTMDSEKKINLVSIKGTEFTKHTIHLAREPLKYSDLENLLFSIFEKYDRQNTVSCLWNIFQKGYLISELLSPINESFDFNMFVQTVFATAQGLNNPEIIDILGKLDLLQQIFKKYTESRLGEGSSHIQIILDIAALGKKVEYPVQVVTHLKKQKAFLCQRIQKNLEEGADALFLLTHQQPRLEHLNNYHRDFHEKYGMNRLVPIKELVSPISGLGIPKITQNAARTKNPFVDLILFHRQFSETDEIVVDNIVKENRHLLEKVADKAPPSLELFFEILSASPEDLDNGNYTLVMNPVVASTQAGSTFGRFLHLWDDSTKERLRHLLKKEESLFPDAAFVEVSFPTLRPRTLNVCFHPSVRDLQLNLQYQNPTETNLELDDIFVGTREESLYLYSKKLGKEIKLTLGTAVNPDVAPPLVKLMLEISEKNFSHFSPCILLDFLKVLHTPRIRYKNIIMSPARWFFDYDILKIEKNIESQALEKILKAVFEAKKLPQFLLLTEFDNRLLVNRHNPDEFKIIVDHFIAKGEIIFYETLSGNPLIQSEKGSHISEFVVPLVRRKVANKNDWGFPPTQQIPSIERIKFIGQSDWLYIKLFLPQDKAPEFISTQLKSFISFLLEKQWIDKWFYIRYHDEKSQIRLRLHGNPEVINVQVLQTLTSWCTHCIHHQILGDYSLNNYEREVERYGGPNLIDTMEDFFYDDSMLCSHLLEGLQTKQITLPAECLAALGIIYILKCCYSDENLMLSALPVIEKDFNKLGGLRAELKTVVKLASFLISGSLNFEAIEKMAPHLSSIFEHFDRCASRLTPMSQKLDPLFEEGISWNSKLHLVDSLVHMHCNRLLGIDPELEKKARIITHYCLKNLKHAVNR
jgi:lantibiotic biosynthesis protein